MLENLSNLSKQSLLGAHAGRNQRVDEIRMPHKKLFLLIVSSLDRESVLVSYCCRCCTYAYLYLSSSTLHQRYFFEGFPYFCNDSIHG